MATHEDELVMAYIAAKEVLENAPICQFVVRAPGSTPTCRTHEGGTKRGATEAGCTLDAGTMELRKALVDLTRGLKLEVRLA